MRRSTPTRSAACRTLSASIASSHSTNDPDAEASESRHAGEGDEPIVVTTREAEAVQHFLYNQRGLFLEWTFSDKELGQMLVDRQLARANGRGRSSGFPHCESMDTSAMLDAAVEAALDFQDIFELANARLKRMAIEKAELEVEAGELKYWGDKVVKAKAEQAKRLRRSLRREDKLREHVASLEHALDSVQGRCMEFELRDAVDAAHSRSKELHRCHITGLGWTVEALKAALNVLPSATKCPDTLQALAAVSIKTIDDARRGEQRDRSIRGNGNHG